MLHLKRRVSQGPKLPSLANEADAARTSSAFGAALLQHGGELSPTALRIVQIQKWFFEITQQLKAPNCFNCSACWDFICRSNWKILMLLLRLLQLHPRTKLHSMGGSAAPRLWNDLPDHRREPQTVNSFQRSPKTFYKGLVFICQTELFSCLS